MFSGNSPFRNRLEISHEHFLLKIFQLKLYNHDLSFLPFHKLNCCCVFWEINAELNTLTQQHFVWHVFEESSFRIFRENRSIQSRMSNYSCLLYELNNLRPMHHRGNEIPQFIQSYVISVM